MSGGGSAFLKSSYCVNPWEGLTRNLPADASIEYALGCYGMPSCQIKAFLINLSSSSSQVPPNT